MVLGVALSSSIELCAPLPETGQQAKTAQGVANGVTGGVDGGGISQRRFHLSLNAIDLFGFAIQKFPQGAVTLAGAAGLVGQGEVAEPIRATPATRLDMFNLQGQVALSAIGAGASILQQIFTHFVAAQFVLLIFDAADGGAERTLTSKRTVSTLPVAIGIKPISRSYPIGTTPLPAEAELFMAFCSCERAG